MTVADVIQDQSVRGGATVMGLTGHASLAPIAMAGTAAPANAAVLPGQVVVASELWTLGPKGTVTQRRTLESATLVASELRHDGHDVVVGPVLSVSSDGPGPSGALVVDHDSAWASLIDDQRPLAVVRAVEGAPVPGAMSFEETSRASRALERLRPPLERWARACQARRVILAAPRSFCAGVERAIETVERALDRYGGPVYVRRQIVHNTHVVRRLEQRGAIFVEELDEVPDGATVVLAAHGVSPQVREQARERAGLLVIDATCPLVAKVHHEARRYAQRRHQIVLIGHAEHEEVVGTVGEAPSRIHVVGSKEDVDRLELDPGDRVAYLTQTTLATDETAEVLDALRGRFPGIVGPSSDDICYATQNRQDAVRLIAHQCDLVLVVGSKNSSNTARLVEVARREGCRAELVEDASQLRLSWLDGAKTIGLTAGASAPESLVGEILQALSSLGPLEVHESGTTEETVRFALPLQVR